jgi:hypothetical protein
MSGPIDWRTALVRYMAHVGNCEGVFFADSFEPGMPEAEWQKIQTEASALTASEEDLTNYKTKWKST